MELLAYYFLMICVILANIHVFPVPQDGSDSTIASDLPRGVALLSDLTTSLRTAQATFDALAQRIKDGQLSTAQVGHYLTSSWGTGSASLSLSLFPSLTSSSSLFFSSTLHHLSPPSSLLTLFFVLSPS